MSTAAPKRKLVIAVRLIASLVANPSNAAAFKDLTPAQFEALKADIKRRGQQHPIDILPDGTVVGGHQRLRACSELGWTEIQCRVRYDLEAAGPAAVEQAMIGDNLHRRQLSPLQTARALWALRKADGSARRPNDVIDELAILLGRCTRNARRYVNVLTTPQAIQIAFEAGRISLNTADCVASLPPEKQQRIAAEIGQGESAKAVIAAAVSKKLPADQLGANKPRVRVLDLIAMVRDLTREREASRWIPPKQVEDLREAITTLIAALDASPTGAASSSSVARRIRKVIVRPNSARPTGR